jgi:hypothetical protein
MRTKLNVLIAVLVVLAACGTEATDGGDPGSGATVTTQAEAEPTGEPSEEPEEKTSVLVWQTKGEFLYPESRSVPATPRIGAAAVEALLEGPVSDVFGSAMPEGAALNGLVIDDGTATVDLNQEFEQGGGSLLMRLRLGQLVYTLTEFPTVKRVTLKLDGSPIEAFGGEGIVIGDGLTRKDFADLVAPIVVETPQPGDEVSSPIEISGTANVFEATVSIRIVDAEGNELYSGFTTATCGTGCRGDFTGEAPVDVDETTQATVEVFSASAEDGSPMHVVEVPVIIEP